MRYVYFFRIDKWMVNKIKSLHEKIKRTKKEMQNVVTSVEFKNTRPKISRKMVLKRIRRRIMLTRKLKKLWMTRYNIFFID